MWNGSLPELKYQKAIHRVRFKEPFEALLLVYLLELLAQTGGLERRFTGSTIKHFTWEAFVQLPVPVPPLDEQRRIVAEIEQQFTRLGAGVTALRQVQAKLKRYRAAVLKAACEGRLVPTEAELARQEGRPYEHASELLARILTERRKNWQARGRYQEPVLPDTIQMPLIPEGWQFGSLEQVTNSNRPICYGILMPKDNVPTGVLYVKVKDMKGDKINIASLHRTTQVIAAKYARASLQTADLLLSIRGTFGRIAETPLELDGGNITQDTARLETSRRTLTIGTSQFVSEILTAKTTSSELREAWR